jgi:hypothetical protein
MALKRRKTLKNFFENGSQPSEDNFSDLIDSNLNMLDEGFKKSPENGLEISTPVGERAFISFFRDAGSGQDDRDNAENSRIPTPLWKLAHGGIGERLLFQAPRPGGKTEPRAVLSMDKAGRVAINPDSRSTNAERREGYELDVFGRKHDYGGIIRSGGRQGWGPKGWRAPSDNGDDLETDGEWHAITEPLRGCHAFEVMARASDGGHRVSLMHAIAVSTNGRKPWWFLWRQWGIRYTHAYWGSRCDKLQLCWDRDAPADKNPEYCLKIRTKCNWAKGGGNAGLIKCYVTRLWFDEADPDKEDATSSVTSVSNSGGSARKAPSI